MLSQKGRSARAPGRPPPQEAFGAQRASDGDTARGRPSPRRLPVRSAPPRGCRPHGPWSLGIARASPSGLTAASPPLQDSAPCPPAAPGNHPASPVLGGSQAACDASCTWNRGIAQCLSCYLLAASFRQFSGPWCWLRLVEWTSGVVAQRGSRRLTVA